LAEYSIVGIFIVSSVIIIGLFNFSMNNGLLTLTDPLFAYATTTSNISHSEHMSGMHHDLSTNATMSSEDKKRFCGNDILNSNLYVNEFVLPVQCSQPVGLAVDRDNNIWVASGKSGSLFVFNTTTLEFDKIIKIPNWIEQTRIIGSMIWDMNFDRNGDLWFTDELSNSVWKYFVKEGKFENYRLLEEGGYPQSITFDSDGNVWFTQVFGNRLGFIEPSKVVTNTTEGISELDMSRQIDFQTMGPVSTGFGFGSTNTNITTSPANSNETIWFSTAIFPVGGHIIGYDVSAEALTIHNVTYTHNVPFSIAEDENGLLWTNSHIANLFFSLNPNTGEIKQYATSNPSASGNLTTLPYYNEYRDGKVWFNEHYGNAIASFDPKNKTLVEYYVPSQNPLWVNSSNPLRFIFDNNGSIWFTEWTENKLGVITKDRLDQIPITLGVSKDRIVLDSKNNKSDSIDIHIYKNLINSSKIINSTITDSNDTNVTNGIDNATYITMDVTSSISKNGKLANLTSSFSQDSIPVAEKPSSEIGPSPQLKTTLEVNPTIDVIPGNYTLTVSAKYGKDVTVSKMVDLEIK
jgi:virginiamycin B lyase